MISSFKMLFAMLLLVVAFADDWFLGQWFGCCFFFKKNFQGALISCFS